MIVGHGLESNKIAASLSVASKKNGNKDQKITLLSDESCSIEKFFGGKVNSMV